MSETTELETEVTTKTVAKVSDSVKAFAKMATMIPAQDPEQAVDSIIAQILAADSVDSLDSPWRTDKLEELMGHPLELHDLKRMDSDFSDGLGVYLVVRGFEATTGEEVTFTTGSVSVVAQLVKAYASGWFPLRCMVVESERPSRNGYKPHHIEILR